MTATGQGWVGRGVLRREDEAFLKGAGRYVDDIHHHGMLEAAFVRSPMPHARILSVNVEWALGMPGVHAVYVLADLPEPFRAPIEVPQLNPAIEQLFVPHALARDEVTFVGETVAIVVADNRYLAEDAAALVEVDYEPLPAINDALDAIEPGAPLAHAAASSNIAGRMTVASGDTDAAFADAAHVFGDRIHIHRGGAFSMECRGLVASWDGGLHRLTIEVATQSPHRLHRAMLELLGCDASDVRVISTDVGGGFGPKAAPYPEYFAVAGAAMLLGRPVKWIEDRRENFLATYQERDQYWDVEIAVDTDAQIRGLRGRLVHETGPYLPAGVHTPWVSATTVPNAYVVPAYRMDVVMAMTNKVPLVPVRGSGRPQGVFVMERMLDRVALELGIDRAEVRRRNFVRPEQMPYDVGIKFRDGTPVIYDSGDYPACQARAIGLSAYDGFEERRAAARAEGRYIGIGIANGVESTGLGPYEGATVRISANGRIAVYVAGSSQGQGHKTAFTQIVAEHLGVDYEAIDFTSGDTGLVALGHGTFGARMAVTAGSSVHQAAADVANQCRRVASEILDVPEGALSLRGGRVVVADDPDRGVDFRTLAKRAIGAPGVRMRVDVTPGLESTAHFVTERHAYANGSHVVEVEVDIETGLVRLGRYHVVHDCGRVINPLIVEGQMIGGVAHAVGNALFERMVYDADAQPLSTNFGEYLLPMAGDVPRIELDHMETPSPLNPLGAKGAGEGGTIVGLAAIISAVNDALSPFGVWINESPISPQRIVELLAAASTWHEASGNSTG